MPTGNTFTMHGTIDIDDLARFMSDPEHAGSITGSIDFEPLGLNLPSTSGVFNLFSPTDDPTMKYMVYELGFNASDGKTYYMAGREKSEGCTHYRHVESHHHAVHSASSGH